MDNFPRLETERLVLRELRASDADAAFEIYGDPAVTRYYDVETLTSVVQARHLLTRMRERNAAGDALRWGITLPENDLLIGTAGFNQFRQGWFTAGVGYDLARSYWNRGYMTEALGAILGYGFDRLNVNRIEALVVPGNVASERVLEKFNFQREGVLREYGFWKNQFWDLELYALLKRDRRG